MDGQCHAPAALPLEKRPSIHCIAGWVGARGSLDVCRKSCSFWNLIPGPSSLWQAATPTMVSWHGKAIIIKYSGCVFVALVILHTKHMCVHCHLWPVQHYHIFPHYLINCIIFGKQVTGHKMCLDFLYNFCLTHFSFSEEFIEILS